MDRYHGTPDLAPEELSLDRVLAAAAPVAPPIGFRDAVMRQVGAERPRAMWEWVVAAALALPSLAYLVWDLAANGSDFIDGLSNAFLAAQGAQAEEFFFVDGLVVIAVALIGVASVVAAHASLGGAGAHGQGPLARSAPRRTGVTWSTGAKLR